MDRNKLYVDRWFKLPPKEKINKNLSIKSSEKGAGKNYAKKSHEKNKKQRSKKRG